MAQTRDLDTYDAYGFERFEENTFPLAYLITFTTYGTWLHGDHRGSQERSRDERFGTRRRQANVPLREKMRSELKQESVVLDRSQRAIVEAAVKEVCEYKDYLLRAINVRTNHSHVVVSKSVRPERIMNDFKVHATKQLRATGSFRADQKVWTRGGSTRYLWKPTQVEAAIEYVLFSQGDIPPGTVTELP